MLKQVDRVLLSRPVTRLGGVQALLGIPALALIIAALALGGVSLVVDLPAVAQVGILLGVALGVAALITKPLIRSREKEALASEIVALVGELLGWIQSRETLRPVIKPSANYLDPETTEQIKRNLAEIAAVEDYDRETVAIYQEKFAHRLGALHDRTVAFGVSSESATELGVGASTVQEMIDVAEALFSHREKLLKQ